MKKITFLKLLVSFIFVIYSVDSFSINYYVSTTGNDVTGDGSQTNPWLSVYKAFTTVTPDAGNIIYIGTGTFPVTVTLVAPSGTNIVGEGVDKTILSSSLITLFQIKNSTNITLKDFTIDGHDISQVLMSIVNCSNIKLFNVNLQNGNGRASFSARTVKNLVVDGGVYTEAGGRGNSGSDFAVVEWKDITNGVFQNITINDTKAEAFKALGNMINVVTTKCVFNGCKTSAWNNGASGNLSVEWFWVTNAINCEISYCSMNGTLSLACIGLTNKYLRVHHNDITGNYGIEMTMSNVEIDHNYIHDCGYAFANFGSGDVMVNQLIHHNVLYRIGSPTAIMHYSGKLSNAKVYNNTVYIESSAVYNFFAQPVTSLEFKNNIFVNTFKLPFDSYGQIVDHNLFQNTPAIGGHSIQADPIFTSVSTGLAGMELQSSSSAIDKGIVIPYVTDNVTDGKPDLGAFEYGDNWTVGPLSIDSKPVIAVFGITYPTNGQVIMTPANVTITADGICINDTIAKIEFYNGINKLGESTVAPYSFVWNNVQKGNYRLTTILIDKKGQITISPAVNITVTGITTQITSPTSGTKFAPSDSITIQASGSVVSGTINKVEFYCDTIKVGESISAPYHVVINNLSIGQHELKVKATDIDNQTLESPVVVIKVESMLELIKSTIPPTIDGIKDAIYTGKSDSIKVPTFGVVKSNADLSARWTGTYDDNNLYFFVEVTDDFLFSDSGAAYRDDDCIEIMIDKNNVKPTTYGSDDYLYAFQWNKTAVKEVKHSANAGVEFKLVQTGTGYNLETKIPWTTIGGKPTGNLLGMEIQIDDDDDGGNRDRAINWNSNKTSVISDPSLFGTVKLGDAQISAIANVNDPLSIRVSPNPSNGLFKLECGKIGNTRFTVIDLCGKVISSGKINQRITTFDLSSHKGIYFVRLDNDKTTYTSKLVLQ